MTSNQQLAVARCVESVDVYVEIYQLFPLKLSPSITTMVAQGWAWWPGEVKLSIIR